jgi:hypothetical protein
MGALRTTLRARLTNLGIELVVPVTGERGENGRVFVTVEIAGSGSRTIDADAAEAVKLGRLLIDLGQGVG